MFKNFDGVGCFSGAIVGFLLTFIAIVLSVIMSSWIPVICFFLVLIIVALLPFFSKLKIIPDMNVGVLIGLILALILVLFTWDLFVFSSDE